MDSAAQDLIGRIERLHLQRGLSQRGLAEKAGLSVTQMNRIMNLQRKLTAAELGLLSDALGVSASELLGEDAQRLSVAARVGRAERAAELEGPFARAEQLLSTRELLDRVISRPEAEERPRLRVPSSGLFKDQGQVLAVQLRAALGLGDECVEDLPGLAARFGLDVSTQPLPENLHGLLVTDTRRDGVGSATAVALLNGYDTHGRRRFTLAHELGHLLFGDGSLVIADYKPEYKKRAGGTDERWTPESLVELRADNFAKHLLAPDAGLRAVAAELGAPGADKLAWAVRLMVEVSVRFGISFESAGYRANDVGLLSDEERAAADRVGAHRAFIDAGRAEERNEVLATAAGVEPPSALLAQALTAYQSEMLGLKPLATLYDLATADELEGLRAQLRDAGWAPESATQTAPF